jgi:uncharacterized membrane protein
MTIVDKDTKKASWRRSIIRLIRSLAIVYLLVMVCMMFLEESLIFFPSRYPDGDWKPWIGSIIALPIAVLSANLPSAWKKSAPNCAKGRKRSKEKG